MDVAKFWNVVSFRLPAAKNTKACRNSSVWKI